MVRNLVVFEYRNLTNCTTCCTISRQIFTKGLKKMEAVAYSNFRQNLRSYMKQVNEDAETLIVTSKDVEDTVVVLSKRDYDSMQETLRVLSNDYVMDKIRRGDKQFSTGNFETHDLLEVDIND